MAWLKKALKRIQGESDDDRRDVDYYEEGIALLRVGKYHEAVTSLRLALRERPDDTTILQEIAIAYTRIGITDEAKKVYRSVLDRDPDAVGAHYGLAFLLLREGRTGEAVRHLQAFLRDPPDSESVQPHVEHARQALKQLTDPSVPPSRESTDG